MTAVTAGTGGAADTPSVDVQGVWKRFGDTDVVVDLSFDVRPGEVLGFLGPNGSGKTTTMRMILDIVRPARGQISVFGGPPGVEHQGRIGYLPEDRGLYRDVKIIDTLTYFGALRGLSEAEARRRARRLLEEMGLGDAAEKKAAELSRGMHQKAQLIATILNDPDLLIIDEPFQGLDPVNADMLKGVVREQRDRGRGRDHEHARHGRRPDAVRPHPAHRQGPASALRHGRAGPRGLQRRRRGGERPRPPGPAARSRASSTSTRWTARCATSSARAPRPRTSSGSSRRVAPRSTASPSRHPASTRSSSARSRATARAEAVR